MWCSTLYSMKAFEQIFCTIAPLVLVSAWHTEAFDATILQHVSFCATCSYYAMCTVSQNDRYMDFETSMTCRMRDTAVVRASDDFYPRNEASSSPHIAACAFNSMFIGALAQPDWDMFHSRHAAAEMHATARAVSGGAVYVSDYPGQHGFDILRRLVLSDGSVLRARFPGRPTRDSLFCDVLRDGKSLLKVWVLLF